MVLSHRRLFWWGLGLLLLIAPGADAQTNELRAFWVDAWGTGFQTASQVNTLTNDLRIGKLNAVFPQVRRRGDAFYNGVYEPKNSGISASFDPLADLVAKCHNTNYGQYLEVHAWIVTYHIWQGTTAPSQPTHPFNLHPDWLLQDVNGNTLIGNEYTFDPGHPEVQKHTFNVAMSIVTNYNVDGLNFDYIRYSALNEGYHPVTVARFNQRFGRTGQPATTDELWKQFRRDQITGLLRKVYLHAIAVKPQIKISCDTITWSPGPTSLSSWYSSATAWNTVLQDWRGWMQEGIMDLNLPMAYFDQAGAYTVAWTNWNNFTKDHQYNRHAAIGPGLYLNSTSDAIVQMRHTRAPSPAGNSARGVIGYSYRVTNKDGVARTTFLNALVNASAYDPVSPPIFSQLATIPTMPWKTAPTNGHLKGTITGNAPTNLLDGAVVSLTGPVNRSQTNDATGFYGFVDLPPGSYTITGSFAGYVTGVTNVTISASAVSTRDLNLAIQGPPGIAAQPQSRTNYVGTPASFTVSASGPAPLAYQWRKDGANLSAATNTTHQISVTTTNDAADYTVVVTNSFGAVTSQVATLTIIVPPVITAEPADLTVTQGQNATFNVDATGTAPLSYQWQFNGTNLAGATTNSYTRSNATPAHAGNYSVVVSNIASTVSSEAAVLSVQVAPEISAHPASRTVKVGSNVTFTISAGGIPSPAYQWRFNNNPIAGETGVTYVRSNAQLAHAGNYSVIVSNAAGDIVSSNAALTVLPLAPLWMQSLAPLPDGRMTLVITGEPGYAYAVERTTNFSEWQEITNLSNPTGTSAFTDPFATNSSKGFYRARQ